MFPFIAAAFLILSGILLWRTYHHKYKLPPGPMALPIIGNLQLLGNLPYRGLHKLSKKYGPIMSISLGSVQAFVVSSPDTAKLFLGTYDATFASRPNLQMSKYLSYGSKGIALAEHGPYLWDVRKFCMVELLSDVKVSGFESMRRTEVGLMVKEIETASVNQKVVNLSEIVGHLIEGMTCMMLFGKKGDERFDFKSLADEIMMAGVFNLADYVPMLAPFDIQGLTRRLKLLSNQIDGMLETLIHEHEQQTLTTSEKTQLDFIDIMLLKKYKDSNTQDKQFDRSSMKAIILEHDFSDMEVDLHGHDFSLIPFSSGRRACAGRNLGLINIGLVIANLAHCFNQRLPNDMSPNDLDMSEKFGFTTARAAPYRCLSCQLTAENKLKCHKSQRATFDIYD